MIFGPTHTFRSACRQLATGLRDGSSVLRAGETTCPKCRLRSQRLHRDADDCVRELRQRLAALEAALCDEIALLDAWGRHQQLGAPLHQRADELRGVLLGVDDG